MTRRDLLFIALCTAAIVGLSFYLPHPEITAAADLSATETISLANDPVVAQLNAVITAEWEQADLTPADEADSLLIARRLSLALVGTAPSLEEIRQLESVPEDQRIDWWLEQLLNDRRYADYVAERLGRAYVGVEDGPFIIFRRRRFVSWLSDCLHNNMPYDELVRHLIADEGIWTSQPAVNFVTVTFDEMTERPDPVRLAARTTRAFLGVRLDCMQCHDDNLGGSWLQSDFHQLAAFYADAGNSIKGVFDKPQEYNFKYLHESEEETVPAEVPFNADLFHHGGAIAGGEGPASEASSDEDQSDGTQEAARRRKQLADWVTHPENGAFARAMVNRAWALMFGKPMVDPVDNIPLEGPWPAGMEILADDFVAHDYDLRRLWQVIAATDAFHRDSRAEHDLTEQHETLWAAFPLTRLRPEQVAGSIIQASKLTTIDADSHILTRFGRFTEQGDFVKRYGDTGEDEFDAHGGTIPQRLLMMNGKLVRERTKDDFVANASTRIAAIAPDNESAIEASYLAILSRRPTEKEATYFGEKLAGLKGGNRTRFFEDLYWSLLNSTEASWNH